MRYPAFVAEMAREDGIRKMRVGVFTGYVTVACLLGLAAVASHYEIIAMEPWMYALLIAKLVTNTAMWIVLRTRVLVLEVSGLNIFADLVLITAAMYFTGGQLSPLLPLYFVETSVMALLTNVGLTIATVVLSFLLYAAMVIAVQVGALPQTIPPIEFARDVSTTYTIFNLLLVALVLFGPGAYVATIVQRLRQREKMLEERARDLVRASETKSQFMANVTHELRTPLHGILGVTELVADGIYGPVTERQKESCGVIQHSARSLLELIDSLLMLARAETAKLEVTVGPVSIDETVTVVIATGQWMIGKKALTIESDIAADLRAVRSDRRMVVQILLNLLSNAIKFTPEGGRVSVTARNEATGGIAIAVADTGIGIPPEELERIFEDFHQVDGSASRDYGGAGVGLALAQRLATRLGGRIAVQSTVGEGSTFTLHLPADVPPEHRSSRPPTAAKPSEAARPTSG